MTKHRSRCRTDRKIRKTAIFYNYTIYDWWWIYIYIYCFKLRIRVMYILSWYEITTGDKISFQCLHVFSTIRNNLLNRLRSPNKPKARLILIRIWSIAVGWMDWKNQSRCEEAHIRFIVPMAKARSQHRCGNNQVSVEHVFAN